MSRKRYRPEEIIGKLRGADVLLSQGGRGRTGTTRASAGSCATSC